MEVCRGQTIGNSFRFFSSLFSRFFFFLFSILCTRRIVAQLTMNIGYRYVCAWRVKMNFCANAFHVCEAAWNNEQEQYNHKVKQCRFVFANTRSRAPFFLSLSASERFSQCERRDSTLFAKQMHG